MKNHKLRNIFLIAGTVITALLAVVVILISSTLQQRGSEPVAPNVPESKPQAAVPESCSISFTVEEPEVPVPLCDGKMAYKDVASNTEGNYNLTAANAIASGTSLTPGTTFVYHLKSVPIATADAPNVKWEDVLDPRLEFVDASDGCTTTTNLGNGQVTVKCDLGAPAANADYSVSIRVKVKDDAAVGVLNNTGKLLADNVESDTCALPLTIAEEIIPGVVACAAKEAHTAFFSANSSETATKIPTDGAVSRGQEFNYRVYFTIPDDATDVLVTDTLPSQLTFVQSASNIPAGITYDAATNKVTIPFATVQATDNTKKLMAEFRVKVKADAAAGAFTNTAQVTTDGEDPSTCAVALKVEVITSTSTGFYVVKYNDVNGDASRQDGEAGLSWDFEWDLNGDNNWRVYKTYDTDDGRGGNESGLKATDKVRVREKGKDGWSSTTPNQVELTLSATEIKKAEFGNRQKTTLGCNNSCSTNSDCASGLSCSNGTCRNAACSSKTNCICDVVSSPTPTPTTTAAAPTPTPTPALPEAGSTAETFGVVAVGVVITILGVIGLFAL